MRKKWTSGRDSGCCYGCRRRRRRQRHWHRMSMLFRRLPLRKGILLVLNLSYFNFSHHSPKSPRRSPLLLNLYLNIRIHQYVHITWSCGLSTGLQCDVRFLMGLQTDLRTVLTQAEDLPYAPTHHCRRLTISKPVQQLQVAEARTEIANNDGSSSTQHEDHHPQGPPEGLPAVNA
jgi:hypothetical protein